MIRCEAIVSEEEIRKGFVARIGSLPVDPRVPQVPWLVTGPCPNEADYVFEELQGKRREVALCDQHTYAFLNNPNMAIVQRGDPSHRRKL